MNLRAKVVQSDHGDDLHHVVFDIPDLGLATIAFFAPPDEFNLFEGDTVELIEASETGGRWPDGTLGLTCKQYVKL